jgi:stage V sporulation protein R
MQNFRDESFIQQYLSPKVMRDFRMFALTDDAEQRNYEVQMIHNDAGYKRIRNSLSEQYRLESRIPSLKVVSADMKGDRTLVIEHKSKGSIRLKDAEARGVLEHIVHLWGYGVTMKSVDEKGTIIYSYEAEVDE